MGIGGTAITDETNSSFAIPTYLTAAGSPYRYYCVISATDATPVSSRVVVVKVDPSPPCNAMGYGYLIFALIGIVPFVHSRKK